MPIYKDGKDVSKVSEKTLYIGASGFTSEYGDRNVMIAPNRAYPQVIDTNCYIIRAFTELPIGAKIKEMKFWCYLNDAGVGTEIQFQLMDMYYFTKDQSYLDERGGDDIFYENWVGSIDGVGEHISTYTPTTPYEVEEDSTIVLRVMMRSDTAITDASFKGIRIKYIS